MAWAGIEGVFELAGAVGYFFNFYVAGCAVYVDVEDAEENPDSQSRAGDEIVFLDDIDVGYSAVSRCQQYVFVCGYDSLRVSEKKKDPNQNKSEDYFD